MIVLRGPVRELTAVAFSPDGAEVAACGGGPLHRWRDGARRDHEDGVFDLGYTVDGCWLVYTRQPIGLEMRGGSFALDRANPARPPIRLPGDRLLATAGNSVLTATERFPFAFGLARLTGRPPFPWLWQVPEPLGGMAATLLPDGRTVGLERDPSASRVVLRAADTGEVQAATPLPRYDGQLLASPDGERLVLNAGTRLYVWRTADLSAPPAEASLTQRRVRQLVWHPSGAYLLGVGADGTVRRLDPDTWQRTATYTWPGGKARTVAIAPDGLTAAVGTSRGAVVRFDLD